MNSIVADGTPWARSPGKCRSRSPSSRGTWSAGGRPSEGGPPWPYSSRGGRGARIKEVEIPASEDPFSLKASRAGETAFSTLHDFPW